ncbi:MAG: hypothetical protein ACYC26_15090 [Phycisphaerales bacterium]
MNVQPAEAGRMFRLVNTGTQRIGSNPGIKCPNGFSYVATCQPVLGWGAGIVSGSGQSAIGARNLDGHAAHEIVYEADAAYSAM